MTENELLFELIRSFKNIHEGADKVLEHHSPQALRQLVNLTLGPKNNSDEIASLINDYIKYSVKTGHKQYVNQLFGGYNETGVLGDVLATLMNTSMYTYEVSPMATLIEKEVVAKMNSYSGFANGDGIFTAGGSSSNNLAMLCARHQKYPDMKTGGLSGRKPLSAFVSDQAHYSFQKASYALGLGSNYLVSVASNELGQMIPEALEAAIEHSKARGEEPFFIAATAGTTELGAFDPIEPLAHIAEKHQCWLHVDGSWGGSLILSQKHRHLFSGIQKAQSFAWNAHKLMNAPLTASVLLVANPTILYEAVSADRADYLFHDHEDASFDLGKKSLQCGRRNDALKVWLAWKAIGDEQYEKNINHLMELAQYCAAFVEAHKDLELLSPVQTLNINFRFKAPEGIDANELNLAIRNQLLHEGQAMVNYCHLQGRLSIRLVLVNHQIQKSDLEQFFTSFVSTAKKLVAEVKI
ncbi:glutamate decarboxylase [bacterium]|nr:glutamate decarboxylase [bacterium]